MLIYDIFICIKKDKREREKTRKRGVGIEINPLLHTPLKKIKKIKDQSRSNPMSNYWTRTNNWVKHNKFKEVL